MKTPTRSQLSDAARFALDFSATQATRRPVSIYGEDDTHRHPTVSDIGGRRVADSLVKKGLLEIFVSEESKITETRGRGARNAASASQVPVNRVRLTPDGAKIAQVNDCWL